MVFLVYFKLKLKTLNDTLLTLWCEPDLISDNLC